MSIAKPPSKISRYFVYDPNAAVSVIFDDTSFYNSYYNSPTRNDIRIEEVRPFVEVNIDGELYPVDTSTKRILKSSWFKEKYNFEIKEEKTISKLDKEGLKYYKERIKDHNALANFLLKCIPIINELSTPNYSEMKYELEQSKLYFKEE